MYNIYILLRWPYGEVKTINEVLKINNRHFNIWKLKLCYKKIIFFCNNYCYYFVNNKICIVGLLSDQKLHFLSLTFWIPPT